jgi:hypothetical protein
MLIVPDLPAAASRAAAMARSACRMNRFAST